MSRLISLVAAGLFALPMSADAAGLSSKGLLDSLGSDIDRAAIQRGEIVWTGIADREHSNRALVAAMLVQVPAPLSQVVAALQKDPTLQMGISMPLENSADWSAVEAVIKSKLPDRERQLLLSDDAAEDFNLSHQELGLIQKAGNDQGPMASAWSSMLQNRVSLYRKSGARALPPYQRAGSADIHPGQQLIDATESMTVLRQNYPTFFGSLRRYPTIATGLQQKFLFTADTDDDRPLFVLKHQLVEIATDHALIAERQFYISHSLDALQVVIVCLPTDKGTLIGMLNQTYTGQVAGFGQKIAHRIGRNKVQEKIRPLFEALQKRFPTASQ